MNTKIYFSIIFFSMFSLLNGQTSFGVHAGINFQNINGKDFLGDKLENGLAIGYNAGVNAQIPLAPEFYFQPGLMFSLKGSNLDMTGFDDEVRLGYIEVPLNLLFKPLVGTGHLLLGFGPYVAYGVTSGKEKDDVKYQSSVGLTDDPGDVYLKNFDAGANLFFGYELAGNLSFQVNTQLGLLNILSDYPVQNNKTNFKNTGFGLSVGYRF